MVDLGVRETEVWRLYQSPGSSLQSRTCSKLETGTESPGLDLRTSRTVCGYDKALQRLVLDYTNRYKGLVARDRRVHRPAHPVCRLRRICDIALARPALIQDSRPNRPVTVASLLQWFQTQPAAGFRPMIANTCCNRDKKARGNFV